MDADQLEQFVSTIHASVGADVWPDGGTLYCHACGGTQAFAAADAGHYLKHGWPRHCGVTMLLDRPKAKDANE